MIVSYPMYALRPMQVSINTWLRAVVERVNLDDSDKPVMVAPVDTDLLDHWLDCELLLSQTCGFPLVTELKQQVKLIGTLKYDLNCCRGGYYCSVLCVHQSDTRRSVGEFAGARFAYNATNSQSGFNAVRMLLSERGFVIPFFGESIKTGQHVNSVQAVADGKADICSIDCVTHGLLKRHHSELLENTRVLTTTKLTPGLPLITSRFTTDSLIDQIRSATKQCCEDPQLAGVNRDLMINGIENIDLQTYCEQIRCVNEKLVKL